VTSRSPAIDPEAMAAATRAFFAQLAASGVRHVAVSPGSRSTPLTLAADRTDGLDITIHLDERSGGFFALGLARATRRPVALVCTSGTAAANYLPAVVEAFHSGVPLIVCTADRPPELQHRGAPQTIDQVELYGTHVRWFHQASVAGTEPPSEAVAVAAAAVEVATGPTPGPVHVNWPLREPLEPPDDDPPPPILLNPSSPPAAAVDPGPLAPRTLLVAGPVDLDATSVDAVTALSRTAGWPVVADPASGLRRGSHTPDTPVIATGEHLFRTAWADGHVPDVVVQLGAMPTSKAYRQWLERTAPPRVVTVDHVGRHPDPALIVTDRIDAEAGAWAAAAAARTPVPDVTWVSTWLDADRTAAATVAATVAAQPFDEPAVVGILVDRLPRGANLVVTNSMPIRDLDAFLPAGRRPLSVWANRGANGIDGQVSTALGIAAGRDEPTVLLTGDLALLHDLPGLTAADRLGCDLTVVVVDNDGGGIFSFLPIADSPGVDHRRLFHTPHGLRMADIAAAAGATYQQVRDPGALDTALAMSVGHPGLHVVHVPVDAATNVAIHRAATAAVIEALDR